jgi:uncharacterized protein YeaO (DUF488 family)
MTRRDVRVRRVYDQATDDGIRVLVDRVWPRGLRKDAAALDEWAKDVAPSTELRKWYGHVPEKFAQFESRYRDELATPTARGSARALASAVGRPRPDSADRDQGPGAQPGRSVGRTPSGAHVDLGARAVGSSVRLLRATDPGAF